MVRKVILNPYPGTESPPRSNQFNGLIGPIITPSFSEMRWLLLP